jgi:hypothetical protein
MLMADPCDHVEYTTINEMVSIVLRIAQNFGRLPNPIITAKFKNCDEETQFIRSMYQIFNEDDRKSLYGASFVIFQEKGTSALFRDIQCRFVSPDDIETVMRRSSYLAFAGDVFALRNPTNTFVVSYFSSYLTAGDRIGLKLVGLITFVGDNYKREIVF